MVAHAQRKREPMKKHNERVFDELRPEYDLRQLVKSGVRGKYAKQYHAGTNLVLLDPDIREVFRSKRAVNDALRLVIQVAEGWQRRRKWRLQDKFSAISSSFVICSPSGGEHQVWSS